MSKTGRPTVDTEPVTLRLPRNIIEAVDAFRREESDLPTRPEGIRRLLSDALIQRCFLPAPTLQEDK